MGDMFRSEEMALCQLFLQLEAAYTSLALLGEAGVVQFKDLNEGVNQFQRKFVAEVRRCEEMERKLRFIEGEIVKEGVRIPETYSNPPAPSPRQFIELEAHLENIETEMIESGANAINLKLNYMELTELKIVLEKTQPFFQEQGEVSLGENTLVEDRGQLGFVAGVIPRGKKFGFEKMLWRISRGNIYLRQVDIEELIEDPSSGEKVEKTVFVVFYQGQELKSRVKKICAGFHASFYPCPKVLAERMDMVRGVKARLADLVTVLNQTTEHRQRILSTMAKEVKEWLIMVKKMKAIYHTLNMLNTDVNQKCLIGECWVPLKEISNVQAALIEGGKRSGSTVSPFVNVLHTLETPPTYFRTNKYTSGFHALIQAYGVATYREVNPSLYSIITFPFLFAVMFGDAGHGLILLSLGLVLVLQEKKFMKQRSSNEMWKMMFGGRYIILLMGLFSIYTGLIYNDVFSKMVNIFGTHWTFNVNITKADWAGPNATVKEYQLDPVYQYKQDPYWFGIDPVWQDASNKIVFLNSFKMKLALILGVLHMVFGVFMSTVNDRYFGNTVYIYVQFIPQLLFLVLMFGYLCALMFVKWVKYGPSSDNKTIYCAPNILILFINMVLLSKTTNTGDYETANCDPYMYPYQYEVQMALFFVAILCVPVMLLGKPIYLLYLGGQKKHLKEGEEPEPAGEIWIHQAIHTVEYVLSTISHTASYLRLWALSLAHAELSEVLWQMVFQKGLTMGYKYWGSIPLFVIFALWACGTIAILVVMEGLSALLHTLRLHWVEFCSKFYQAEGYLFVPFSFKPIITGEDEDED